MVDEAGGLKEALSCANIREQGLAPTKDSLPLAFVGGRPCGRMVLFPWEVAPAAERWMRLEV